MDLILYDYYMHRRQARKWARIALDNKLEGRPWQEAAAQAHEHFLWAMTIIA